ncbi:AAA family ATPase [Paenibacillus pabuli]|uniref:AAA family ATPase n=1 Tax=Paenibacillus pabuli TaxID=1472 RepID=UPI0032420645
MSAIIDNTGDDLLRVTNTETYINSKIVDFINSRENTSSYTINNMDRILTEFITSDIEADDESLDFITNIYTYYSRFDVSFDTDIDNSVKVRKYNRLYKYEGFNIYVCLVLYLQEHPSNMNIIFAESEAELRRFYDHLKDKHSNMLRNKIAIATDVNYDINITYEDRNTRDISEMVLDDVWVNSIKRSIDHFFDDGKDFFNENNIPYRRGILLYGPPGNGKSSLIQAVASEVNAPVIYWMVSGNTRSDNIQILFDFIDKISPALLVIEDLDALPDHCRSVFLNTLDGVGRREGIFIIGTTNYPERVDSALVNRAGRFDRTYYFGVPDDAKRAQFFELSKLDKFLNERQIEDVVKLTSGFSFAQLNEVYTSIAFASYFKDNDNAYENIIREMKASNKKGETQVWYKEEKRIGLL